MTDSSAASVACPVGELDLPTFDITSPATQEERIASAAHARERHWLARIPGGYAFMHYADVVAIHRDRRFVNGLLQVLKASGITDPRFLARRPNPFLRSEGPTHARLRRLVSPAFTPRGADRIRPFIRKVLDELFDDIASSIAAKGRADLVADLCDPFPIAVICELLGAPREDWPKFSQWTRQIFEVFDGDLERTMANALAAHEELDEYTAEMIARRRSEPGDDLLTVLIAAEEEGDRLSSEELTFIAEAILVAGTDTTRNQLGCTIAALLRHPDQLARLIEDPDLVPNAVQETLRYFPSVVQQPRYVEEDTVYRDVLFPAGTLLSTSLFSAGFDPSIWKEPERFDIGRSFKDNRQLIFGIGRHSCLGMNLALAELEEAVSVLIRRVPELVADGESTWKPASLGSMWGPLRFPVALGHSH